MRIGNLEVHIFEDSSVAEITKHYNDLVHKTIRFNEDDIYSLEFAVKEIKRNLGLKNE